ncbi:MAG: DUF2235 domain-containing protein [Paludibacteraceae bacterium]|nr:DUF2235 domain-containing protein [Paludibacteraceae bacterium]
MPEQVEGGATSSTDNSQDEKSDTIKAYIFVLFDGTNNNMYNIESYRKLDEEKYAIVRGVKKFVVRKLLRGSSTEEFSNVARLSKVCKTDVSSTTWVSYVYVDGIGTSTSSDSGIVGQGLGVGDLGVEAKVQKGCELIVGCLNDMYDESGKEECQVSLNIAATGFSRGAAAARRFASCANTRKGGESPYNVCLKKHLESSMKENITLENDTVNISVLGLFDTVSSFGVGKTLKSSNPFLSNKETLKEYANNVKELSLNELEADYIFQLCAADEYRLHFGLTKVPEEDKNYIIPGCHSDVGGGIIDNKEEKYSMISKLLDYGNISTRRSGNGNKTKEELLNEGWFTSADIENGERIVSNKYSFIPFTYMLEKVFKKHLTEVNSKLFDDSAQRSLQYGQDAWKNDKELSQKEKSVLDTFLGDVMGDKAMYSFPNISKYLGDRKDEMKILRNKFLHLSSHGHAVHVASPDNERIVI